MRPLLMTTDPVLVSFATSVLSDAGIEAHVVDRFTSGIEGALGIFPCRVLVAADTWHRARVALQHAGLTAELLPETPAP